MFNRFFHCIYRLINFSIPPFLYSFQEALVRQGRRQMNDRCACCISSLPSTVLQSANSSLQPRWWREEQFASAVCVLSNPGPLAGVAKDSNGITNIGHSFPFVLLCYRMVIWEAAPSRLYVIAKMLIATHFLKWRNHIPVWLCCVVLKAGFFCGSIAWITDKNDYFQVLKNVGIVQKFWKSTK